MEKYKVNNLKCVRGQRDASGYDFWYEGVSSQGETVSISASSMRSYGHLLENKWDADEWVEWQSIQEPYTPRKASPRKGQAT